MLGLGMIEIDRPMKVLDLRGNPQRSIRRDILDRGGKEVVDYLRKMRRPQILDEVGVKVGGAAGENNGGLGCGGRGGGGGGEQILAELEEDIQKIQLQMNHAHTTEAKKYALKKQAQFLKAKIIKERRRIKVAAEQTNNSNFKPTF